LAPAQYGLYTVVVSFVGAVVVLTDLGLTGAMLALGARWLEHADALRQLRRQARAMHRRLSLWALPLLPLLVVLLLRQPIDVAHAVVLALLVAGCAWLQVAGGIDIALLRLLGHAAWQQHMELLTQFVRLVLLLLLGAATAWLTLDDVLAGAVNLGVAAALALLARWRITRALPGEDAGAITAPVAEAASRSEQDHAETTAPVDHRPALRGYLWRQGPNSVYYVLNAQIVLWLIAWFGQAETVAQAGALGRLAALFTVVASVTASLLLPYFARARSNEDIGAGLLRVHGFFALLLLLLLGLAVGAPHAMLWVLGGHYGGLGDELIWLVLGTTLASWGGTLYTIACTRGWVMPLGLSAGGGLASTVIAALWVDVGSLHGALLINCAVAATGLLVSWAYIQRQLRRKHPPLPHYA
jgi:hypothetical protein